ncbi:FAD-dependent monooxygenase yanF [Lachnellula arida]|uniref:FAD-dependent monooxygenase yanF n=1 Tax=Lachnellula arida TaxID=1316785 RepID=A0A8T9B797_9HELO|nr:FAD-dependent monooxygenase yanF [Lachnellula arida]
MVNANTTHNSDLFSALKGGGPNFGIVTQFDIHTHPLHRVWYTLNLYAATDYKSILNATVQVQTAMSNDPKLGFFLNINPDVIIAGLLYADWTLTPDAFSPMLEIPSVGVYLPETNGTISTLAASINIGDTSAKREPYAVSHDVDLGLYVSIQEAYLNILNTSTMPSANLSYTIQPIAATGVTQGVNAGGNVLGLIPRSQTWHAALVEWLDDTDDEAAHNSVNTLGSEVETLAAASNNLLEFQFMNDASFTQQPLQSYGAENVARLQDTRQAYDPDAVFQILQNSGFLLSRV